MRHIRTGNSGGRDKRSRGHRFVNKPAPTICGAEPCMNDLSHQGGAHVMYWAQKQPARLGHWVTDVCPACMAKVTPAPRTN